MALTSACGGGGGGGGDAGLTTGSLSFSVTGLPAGLNGSVVVSGPNGFSQPAQATQTMAGLAPGTYTIAATNVLSGTGIYAPQPAMQSIAVAAGATANAVVTYAGSGSLQLTLQEIASGLSSPLFLTAPAGDARLFIVERPGRIRILRNGSLLPTPFLDISTRVNTTGEGGLLSMAFDPQYASNGYFFVYFTDPTGDIAVERFRVSSGDPDLADPAPLRIITITHRTFTNHKGGLVAFGPDGLLYVGTGDGGSGGDPFGNGQNLDSLLGKLLRIDVSGANAGQPYSIPAQNPFVGHATRRAEIWAYGLRNPWRYAFDAPTGLLYVADVGQDRMEEVNAVPATTPGLNYGWNVTEGSLCFPADPCNKAGLILPALEYDHSASGGCSVTGGHVYRGVAIPELSGRYFYSDFCNGWLRSFHYTNGIATELVDWNIASVGQVFSLGQDAQGELYMLTTAGKAYKIVRQ